MNIDNDWFYIRETFVDNTLYEFIIPLENNPYIEHPYLTEDLASIKINASNVNIYKHKPIHYVARYQDDTLEKSHFVDDSFITPALDRLISGKIIHNINVDIKLDDSLFLNNQKKEEDECY